MLSLFGDFGMFEESPRGRRSPASVTGRRGGQFILLFSSYAITSLSL